MTLSNKLFYFFVKWFFYISLKVYNRISTRWLSPLPRRNYIVIANHCSNLDPVVMGAIFPGRLRFLAKSELFEPFIFGSMVRALGATPVQKQDSQSAGAALRAFLKLLDDGENVLLFPEGGRSLDGKLQPLEGGAALIAMKSGLRSFRSLSPERSKPCLRARNLSSRSIFRWLSARPSIQQILQAVAGRGEICCSKSLKKS